MTDKTTPTSFEDFLSGSDEPLPITRQLLALLQRHQDAETGGASQDVVLAALILTVRDLEREIALLRGNQ